MQTEVRYTVPWAPFLKKELQGKLFGCMRRVYEIVAADRSPAGITLSAVARALHADYPDDTLEEVEQTVGMLMQFMEALGLAYCADIN